MPGGSILLPVAVVAEIVPLREHRPLAGGSAILGGGARILGTQPWRGHAVPVCWLSPDPGTESPPPDEGARATRDEGGAEPPGALPPPGDRAGGPGERGARVRRRLAVLHGVTDRRRMPFYGIVILGRPMMLRIGRGDLRPLPGTRAGTGGDAPEERGRPDAARSGYGSPLSPAGPPGPVCPGLDVRLGERISRIPDMDALEGALMETLFQR